MFQLNWTSVDNPTQLLNSNCLGYSFGTIFTRFCFHYFLDKRRPNIVIFFLVSSLSMSSLKVCQEIPRWVC